MHPDASEWLQFYLELNRRTGLDLRNYKPEQLQRRIKSMAEAKGYRTLTEFLGFIKSSPDNVSWFLDKLAINVSELFRNPEKWVELEKHVLPVLARGVPLKIWSAGCSYGAEAHSVACLLADKFPGRHQVVGSDIDEAALAQANRGDFSDNDMRGVPQEYRKRFFEHRDGRWHAKPEIKKYLTFRKGNLLGDRFDAGFDLILCRNVVIYFTDPAKDGLYEKFYQALKPGGYLFVGSTERIFNSRTIGFESPIPFFYQKPNPGAVQTWRNAS